VLYVLIITGLLTGASASTGLGQTSSDITWRTRDRPAAVNGIRVHDVCAVLKTDNDKQININKAYWYLVPTGVV
jgi:hypothetical protein